MPYHLPFALGLLGLCALLLLVLAGRLAAFFLRWLIVFVVLGLIAFMFLASGTLNSLLS